MKYYTISFPGEYGQHVVETWSEDQIIKSYYDYWCGKMIENLGSKADISREKCIEDWKVVHWAIETDQWGKDLGYEVASLEEAIQFSNRRNYPLGEGE